MSEDMSVESTMDAEVDEPTTPDNSFEDADLDVDESESIDDGDQPEADNSEARSKSPKEESKAEKKRYKVKVNEQELEVDEDELLKDYELRKASYQRMEEAAKQRKQIEQLVHGLKNDPISILKQVGLDPRQISEDYLTKELEYELMSPEQKLAQYEQREREQAEQQRQAEEQAQLEKAQQYWKQHVDQQLTKVLSEANLPKSPKFVGRVVDYAKQMLSNGFTLESIPWKDTLEFARQDAVSEAQHFFNEMEGDQLIDLLGEDIINKIRQHDIKRHKEKAKSQAQPEAKPPRPSRSGKREYIDLDSFMSGLG